MDSEEKLDRRQKRSQAAFREALEQLLTEKSLDKITVKELSERADRDRKTFYLHYDSIDDLVDKALNEELTHITNAVIDASIDQNGQMNVSKLYEALTIEMIASLHTNRAAILAQVDVGKAIATMQPILTQVILKRDLLNLSEKLGMYFEPMVTYFCAGLLAMYHQWYTTNSQVPIEHLAELASVATTGGITALNVATKEDLNSTSHNAKAAHSNRPQ